MLLDLRPEPQPFRTVDVRVGERVRRAGRLHRQAFFIADIRGARDALDRAESHGLFRRDHEVQFEYVEHHDSVDSWMECLAKPRVAALEADEPLIESACSKMSQGQAEIIVTQLERAARFTRLG